MKLVFVYNPGRQTRLEGVRKGESPSEFFLGAIELARGGHDIAHVEFAEAPGGFGGQFWKLLYAMGLLPPKAYGGIMAAAWSALELLNKQDAIVATTSGIGFGLGVWKKLGMLKPPLVVVHCGLMNFPVNAWRRRLMASLLSDSITLLYGEGERAPMLDLFRTAAERLRVNLFGVDLTFWTPGPEPTGDYILAVGNDGRRDYATLIKAAASIPVEIRIVTRQTLPEPIPANVKHIKGGWHEATLSDLELRDLYRRARCVVVPLLPSYQPSGQSVALQAMACGRPVIITDTPGFWSTTGVVRGVNMDFVPAEDASAMATAVKRLIADPAASDRMGAAARRYVEQYGDIASFASQVEATCREQGQKP